MSKIYVSTSFRFDLCLPLVHHYSTTNTSKILVGTFKFYFYFIYARLRLNYKCRMRANDKR